MTIQTKTVVNVREKNNELIKKHLPIFGHLLIAEPLFAPKMSFFPKGKDRPYIGVFTSELQKGVDIFTEFVNREHEPEDPDRALWVWRYVPDWATGYEYIEGADNAPSQRRYLIPTSELVKVRVDHEVQTEMSFDEQMGDTEERKSNGQEDVSISDITLRDMAAIILKKPVSNKSWLNEIIEMNK